jgi:hypothetical protein
VILAGKSAVRKRTAVRTLAFPCWGWPSLRSLLEASSHSFHALRFCEHEVGDALQLVCCILETHHSLSERWFIVHMND